MILVQIKYAMCMMLNDVDQIPFLFEEGAFYFEQRISVCLCVLCL